MTYDISFINFSLFSFRSKALDFSFEIEGMVDLEADPWRYGLHVMISEFEQRKWPLLFRGSCSLHAFGSECLTLST